jgi:hypothetical protein
VKTKLFLVLFFIIASLQGYEFGSGDLSLYLPYVMNLHDKTLFNNDLLITSMAVYSAPAWHFVAWLLNFSDPKTVFFALFLLQIVAIIAGAHFFYRQLFGANNGWILFLLLLTISRSSGAMNTFGLNPFSYFQPCGLALGMLLFLYGFLDAGKYKTAGFIAGTMFLYHPISAVWACILFLLHSIIEKKPLFSRNKIIGGFVLIVCASPYIVSYVLSNILHPHEPIAISFWMELAKMRLNHAFFLSRWVPDRFIQLGLVVVGIVLFRRHPAFLRTYPIALAAIIAVGAAGFGELFSSKMIIQLNLLRCTYMVYILFFAFLAFRVSMVDSTRSLLGNIIWVVMFLLLLIMPFLEHRHTFFSYLLIGFSIILSLGAGFIKIKNYQKIIIASGFAMVLFISIITINSRYKTTGACFNTFGTGSWYDMQVWVRDNISQSSRIMTPPYLEGFRSYSQHPIYGDWKDGGSHQFCNLTVLEWWKRMQSLGIALSMKSAAFPRVYHENALYVARKTEIKYVVFDKAMARAIGPVAYENRGFGLLDLKAGGEEQRLAPLGR